MPDTGDADKCPFGKRGRDLLRKVERGHRIEAARNEQHGEIRSQGLVGTQGGRDSRGAVSVSFAVLWAETEVVSNDRHEATAARASPAHSGIMPKPGKA